MWYKLAQNSRPRMNLTQQDFIDIVEFYNLGYSVIEIAKNYNISKSSVMAILNKNNVQMRSPKKPIEWTKDQITNIITSYESGASTISIAQFYGVNPKSISKVLIQNDIPLRTNYRNVKTIVFTEAQKQEICQMYIDGYSLNEIATAFNLKSILAIQRVLEAAKIKRRIDTPRNWTDEEQRNIINLFREGKSIREVAATLKATPNSIHKFLIRNNIDVSPRKGEEWWAWIASKDERTQTATVNHIILAQYHLPRGLTYENWPLQAKKTFYHMMNKIKHTNPDATRN